MHAGWIFKTFVSSLNPSNIGHLFENYRIDPEMNAPLGRHHGLSVSITLNFDQIPITTNTIPVNLT